MTIVSLEVRIIPKETFSNLAKEKQDRILNASFKEFSERSFEDAKLSNIIRDSKIPRGNPFMKEILLFAR